MSTKSTSFILIAALILVCIGLVFWLYVDGSQLPLPEGEGIAGYATRLDIVFDPAASETTHETISFDLTNRQVSALLQLLRESSYRRARYGSSVSFSGDITYAISLAYQAGDRQETALITILDNELIHVLAAPDNASGYLKITDPDFLPKLQAILEN